MTTKPYPPAILTPRQRNWSSGGKSGRILLAVALFCALWSASALRLLSPSGELLTRGVPLALVCLLVTLASVRLARNVQRRRPLAGYASAYLAGALAALFIGLLTTPDYVPNWTYEAGNRRGKSANAFLTTQWDRQLRVIELHASDNPAQADTAWDWSASAKLHRVPRLTAFALDLEAAIPESAIFADAESGAVHDGGDGAVLRVVARDAAEGERPLGELVLDPFHDTTHRGWQMLHVRVPAGTSQLVLQALAGPPGANNWFDRIWLRTGKLRPTVAGLDVTALCRAIHLAGCLGLSLVIMTALAALHARLLAARPAAPAGAAAGPLSSHDLASATPARRKTALCLGLACATAVLARGGMLATYPLLLWSDSQMYLRAALQLAGGDALTGYSWYSAPGYTYFLTGVIAAFGTSPTAILVIQHLLGVLAAGLAALAFARLAPIIPAALLSVLFALDPFSIMWGNWALSESLAIPLFVILLALALSGREPQLGRSIWIGLLCALCYLVRPNLQVAVPLVLLGWMLTVRSPFRLRLLLVGASVLVCLAAVLPWSIYDRERGVTKGGVAARTLWAGLALNGLLDSNYPLPADVREKAQPFLDAGPLNNKDSWKFASSINGRHPSMWPLMRSWALHSVREDPFGYARAVGRCLLWQLDIFPPADPVHRSQLHEIMRRTARAERGLNPRDLWAQETAVFITQRHGGPLRDPAKTLVDILPRGALQVPLVGSILAAAALALARRRFGTVLLACGPLAVFAVNIVFLQSPSRYSAPVWAAGYLFLAALLGELAELHARRAAPRSSVLRGA